MRTCVGCKREKDSGDFRTPRSRWCQPCVKANTLARKARYREQNRDALRVSYSIYYYANIKRRYGITRERYEEILEAQGGACAICRSTFTPDDPAQVDHDHSCCDLRKRSCGSCVRALLCRTCNLGLSYFRDSHGLLSAAAKYLSTHKKETEADVIAP